MMIPLLELCQQLSKSERGGARGRGFDLSGALNLPTFCSNSAQNIAECAVLLTSAPERPPLFLLLVLSTTHWPELESDLTSADIVDH